MNGVRLFLVLGIAVVGLAYLVFSVDPRGGSRVALQGNLARSSDERAADLVIGEPVAFGNLTIFPVSSKTLRDRDRFLTLDEGLQAGTVEIFEKGAAPAAKPPGELPAPSQPDAHTAGLVSPEQSVNAPAGATADPFAPPTRLAMTVPVADPFAAPTGQQPTPQQPSQQPDPFALAAQINAPPSAMRANEVNELVVVNHSNKPLYLMPGEIIIGGQQDRTIGDELVIAPDNKPVSIEVFCVEHGRWSGRDAQTYAGLLPQAGRYAAADLGSVNIDTFQGNLSLVVSQTTEVANAGKFVGSIGSLNKSARIAVQAGEGQGKVWEEVASENRKAGVTAQSGTFAGNYAEPQSAQRLSAYIESLQAPIAGRQNVVGVIVAVNGEVQSLDVFESTPLFNKLWPKLLKSYALDAANLANDASPTKPATLADARKFFGEVAQAHRSPAKSDGALAISRGDSDDVICFAAHERRNLNIGDPESHAAMAGAAVEGMGGGLGGAIHSSGFSK